MLDPLTAPNDISPSYQSITRVKTDEFGLLFFRNLKAIPSIWAGFEDLSSATPRRRGFGAMDEAHSLKRQPTTTFKDLVRTFEKSATGPY